MALAPVRVCGMCMRTRAAEAGTMAIRSLISKTWIPEVGMALHAHSQAPRTNFASPLSCKHAEPSSVRGGLSPGPDLGDAGQRNANGGLGSHGSLMSAPTRCYVWCTARGGRSHTFLQFYVYLQHY